MANKSDILTRITNLGFPVNEVCIGMAEFFSNTKCLDSIGVNIYPNPIEPKEFYHVLKGLIDNKKADQILVRICDAEEPADWFYSDTVFIISELSKVELKKELETLQPDEIIEGWLNGPPANINEVSINSKVYSVWWD